VRDFRNLAKRKNSDRFYKNEVKKTQVLVIDWDQNVVGCEEISKNLTVCFQNQKSSDFDKLRI
jgi:predicted DNA-binding WGR domain protein